MPKKCDDPVMPISFGLRKSDVEYIRKNGTGETLGEKLRNILDLCRTTLGRIINESGEPVVDGAILAYQKTDDETIWADELPFKIDKGKGWKQLIATATKTGFIHQCIENKSKGTLVIWIAPGPRILDCAKCRKKVIDAINSV